MHTRFAQTPEEQGVGWLVDTAEAGTESIRYRTAAPKEKRPKPRKKSMKK
jgi:hypothetical protein